jgi:copper(I)-binding protein
MRRLTWGAALAVLGLGACRAVPVDEAGSVDWSRGLLVAPAPGSPAVFYLVVANPTASADTVLTVRVVGADSARMHQTMAMGNGMEGMSPVAALPLPAHDTVRFAPGGLHVMVFGLSGAVHAGDSAQVTVGFRGTGEVTHWAHVITYAQVDSALGR